MHLCFQLGTGTENQIAVPACKGMRCRAIAMQHSGVKRMRSSLTSMISTGVVGSPNAQRIKCDCRAATHAPYLL